MACQSFDGCDALTTSWIPSASASMNGDEAYDDDHCCHKSDDVSYTVCLRNELIIVCNVLPSKLLEMVIQHYVVLNC